MFESKDFKKNLDNWTICDYILFLSQNQPEKLKRIAKKMLCDLYEEFSNFYYPLQYLKENGKALVLHNVFTVRQNAFVEVLIKYPEVQRFLRFPENLKYKDFINTTLFSKEDTESSVSAYLDANNYAKKACEFVSYAKKWKRDYDKNASLLSTPAVVFINDEYSDLLKNTTKKQY